MNWQTTKVVAKNVFAAFNVAGTLILIIIVVRAVSTSHMQTQRALDKLQAAQDQVRSIEREEVSIVNCGFLLLGRDRTAVVTAAQLNACLKGTSLAPKLAPKPAHDDTTSENSNMASDKSSHSSVATVPERPHTDTPEKTQPTTSAPPPQPNPASPQPIQPAGPILSFLQPVELTIGKLLDIAGL